MGVIVLTKSGLERPDWDETFLKVAAEFSRRSTCPRAWCGAVTVNADRQLLTSGYNGAPRGLPHCRDAGCKLVEGRCITAVHAEANAVVQAARVGVSLKGATLYSTHRPCHQCARLIIQAGIVAVVYVYPYEDGLADVVEEMFGNAAVSYQRRKV